MKKRKSKKFGLILVLILFCANSFALENNIGNTSVPASTGQRGLIRSPNPMAPISGNLVVTGNVTGLSYFHGNVPYTDTTSFEGSLGSSALNDFLRRTAPVTSPTTPRYLPQPYYPTSSTVSSLAPTALGINLTYPSIRATGGTGDFVAPPVPKIEATPKISAASPLYDYSRIRPLSYEPTDLERAVTYERIVQEEKEKKLSIALQSANRGQSDQKPAEEKEKNTLIPQPAQPAEPAEQLKPLNPVKPDEISNQQNPVKDVYEQMIGETKKHQEKPGLTIPAEEEKKPEEAPSEGSELGKIEEDTAKAVVQIHRSFATEAQNKFNYYMRAAEGFLKEDKFYRAVDAYTLASVYKPDDPLAYAGRAHALFASGEYMSSAYFLARAINIFPQYVDVKIDLRAMITDANRLESRIEDIKTWIERSQSPELSFLLAYIYYQLDRNEPALAAIKFSAEKLPDVAAVKTLKQAIEKKQR